MRRTASNEPSAAIVFDLETQKSFAEVGGRTPQNIRKLLLSLAVIYRYVDRRFVTFFEKDARALLSELRNPSCIVGFGLLEFDYVVLERYGKLGQVQNKTIDMMKFCEAELGRRLGLDDFAYATLGARKSADGIRAVELYRQGKIKDLERYCKRDVLLTRKLFEFGRTNCFLYYSDWEGRKQRVAARW